MVAERLKATIRAGNLKTSIVEKAGGDVERISMQALEAAAREGDALAVEEWNHFTDRVAQGIGNLIMILNPEVIVLGTMAIHGGEFVMRPIREKVRKYAWKWPLEACQIVPSTLGGKIGDLGAIAVAMDGLRSAARSP
jgi:glucokinase